MRYSRIRPFTSAGNIFNSCKEDRAGDSIVRTRHIFFLARTWLLPAADCVHRVVYYLFSRHFGRLGSALAARGCQLTARQPPDCRSCSVAHGQNTRTKKPAPTAHLLCQLPYIAVHSLRQHRSLIASLAIHLILFTIRFVLRLNAECSLLSSNRNGILFGNFVNRYLCRREWLLLGD